MKISFALFFLFMSGSSGILLSSLVDASVFQVTVCHEEKLIDEENLISTTFQDEMNLTKHHHETISAFQVGSHLMHGDRLFCSKRADH